MGHFTRHLHELGERVDGSFLAFARAATTRSRRSPTELASWPTWRDVSPYPSGDVPFFKRAQIAAADLALAGLGPRDDLDRLTLFADNLVPHVLRIDGVLDVRRTTSSTASTPASCSSTTRREEVEIRAVALHAVELLVEAHPRADDRRRARLGAVEPRRRAALQGPPAPPRAHDRLLMRPAGDGRCSRTGSDAR